MSCYTRDDLLVIQDFYGDLLVIEYSQLSVIIVSNSIRQFWLKM